MIILRAEVEQIPSPSAPSSPQTLLSGLCASAKSNVAPLRLLFAKIFSSKIFLRGIIVFSIFMASGEAFAPFVIITAQAKPRFCALCYNHAKKGFTCYAFFHSICQPFGFCGKVSGARYFVATARRERNPRIAQACPRVSLKLTKFFRVSSRKNL